MFERLEKLQYLLSVGLKTFKIKNNFRGCKEQTCWCHIMYIFFVFYWFFFFFGGFSNNYWLAHKVFAVSFLLFSWYYTEKYVWLKGYSYTFCTLNLVNCSLLLNFFNFYYRYIVISNPARGRCARLGLSVFQPKVSGSLWAFRLPVPINSGHHEIAQLCWK